MQFKVKRILILKVTQKYLNFRKHTFLCLKFIEML